MCLVSVLVYFGSCQFRCPVLSVVHSVSSRKHGSISLLFFCVRTGKIIALWPPIVAFAVAGFEHSIANMAILGLGVMHGGGGGVGVCLYNNLLPVTIGNILGGSVFVGAMLYFLYIYEDDVMTQHQLAGVVVDEHMATQSEIAQRKLASRTDVLLTRRNTKMGTIEQRTTSRLRSVTRWRAGCRWCRRASRCRAWSCAASQASPRACRMTLSVSRARVWLALPPLLLLRLPLFPHRLTLRKRRRARCRIGAYLLTYERSASFFFTSITYENINISYDRVAYAAGRDLLRERRCAVSCVCCADAVCRIMERPRGPRCSRAGLGTLGCASAALWYSAGSGVKMVVRASTTSTAVLTARNTSDASHTCKNTGCPWNSRV